MFFIIKICDNLYPTERDGSDVNAFLLPESMSLYCLVYISEADANEQRKSVFEQEIRMCFVALENIRESAVLVINRNIASIKAIFRGGHNW